ncbi:hypothetical protein BH11MYX1_BH11MYX1_42350 [soil metagenome]
MRVSLCADALALGVAKNAKRLDDGLYLELAGKQRSAHPKPASPPARGKPLAARR